MIISEGRDDLENNLFRQLSSYWGSYDKELIKEGVNVALGRLDIIFQYLNKETNKYVWKQTCEPEFSLYNILYFHIY